MATENICDDCGKNFSTKSNLNAHKNKSRSCSKNSELLHVCGHCSTELSSARNLKKHEEVCINKKIADNSGQLLREKELEFSRILKEKELEFLHTLKEKTLEFSMSLKEQELLIKEKTNSIISLQAELKTTKEYNKDLQDRLERFTNKIIEKPSSSTSNNKTINNNNINITFFTQEHIDKQVKDNFSRDHLILGAKGVAKFTHEFLAKDGEKLVYVCTDPARQVFYFDAPDGSRTKDFKGTKLTKALQKPICDKSLKIVKDAGYSIEYLNELEKRSEQQERELRLYKFAQERWGEISSELVLLNDSNFVMELSKLISL